MYTAYLTFFVAMLAIMNPIGNLAIFISLVADRTVEEQKQQARETAISIIVVLLLITWAGNYLLSFLGISSAAFESAGALIIILLGLSMMKGHDNASSGHHTMHYSTEEHNLALKKDSIAVVPLCIPIVAGPGAITTIIVHSNFFNTIMDKCIVSGICLVLAFILYICFHFSSKINQFIGPSGVKIATRVMGLILTAIAFQMLGSGLAKLLPGLS